MVDDANTQRDSRYTFETISTTPTLGGVFVKHVREPSSLSDSRVDEEELDHNVAIHHFSEVSLGLNRTVSAAEKTFKREEYIYVSFLSLFFFASGSSLLLG